jgi:hypothetical protein
MSVNVLNLGNKEYVLRDLGRKDNMSSSEKEPLNNSNASYRMAGVKT